MYLRQQKNTYIFFHSSPQNKVIRKSNQFELTGFRKLYCKSMATMLLIPLLMSMMFECGYQMPDTITFSNSVWVQNIMSYSRKLPSVASSSPSLMQFQKKGIEFFENGEEIEEDLKKKVRSIFYTMISIYRMVTYTIKTKIYFSFQEKKSLSPHQPFYLKYCSLKILT